MGGNRYLQVCPDECWWGLSYFDNSFPPEFEVVPKPEYQNHPQLLTPQVNLASGRPASPAAQQTFTQDLVKQLAAILALKSRDED